MKRYIVIILAMTLLSCLPAKQMNSEQTESYLFDPSESLALPLKQYESSNSLQVPAHHVVINTIQQPEFIAELKRGIIISSQNIKKKPKAPKRQGIIYVCDNDIEYIKTCDCIGVSDCGYVGVYTCDLAVCYPIYGKVKTMARLGDEEASKLTFNAKGDLSEICYPVSDSTDPGGASYSYDSNGRLNSFWVWGCANSALFPDVCPPSGGGETFKYDSRGNIVFSEYVQSMWVACHKQSIYSYKYDSRNNIIAKVVQTEDKWCPNSECDVAYYNYEYDAKNNITAEANLNTEGELVYRYNYKYDSRGNLVEVTLSGFSGFKSKRLFYYNTNGVLLLSEHYGEDYNLASYTLYKYDKRGNLIEKSQFDSNQNLQNENSYKYDRMGNVVESVGNEPYLYFFSCYDILKMKITYYK